MGRWGMRRSVWGRGSAGWLAAAMLPCCNLRSLPRPAVAARRPFSDPWPLGRCGAHTHARSDSSSGTSLPASDFHASQAYRSRSIKKLGPDPLSTAARLSLSFDCMNVRVVTPRHRRSVSLLDQPHNSLIFAPPARCRHTAATPAAQKWRFNTIEELAACSSLLSAVSAAGGSASATS